MLRVFRDRAPTGRTGMARHRCRKLPRIATGRLSRFLRKQAQMFYCLIIINGP